MAEAVGFAASVLGIAGVGVSITTNLYRFTNSYRNVDRKVEGIVSAVSVTASILTELGNTTKKHPEDLQKLNRWALLSNTIAACKKDFRIIDVAIGEARKGANKGKATPWQKLKWSIGGEEAIDDLLSSLEQSKSNLQLLLDASSYDILRKLENSYVEISLSIKQSWTRQRNLIALGIRLIIKIRHALSPQLAEQLAEIRKILPWLVTNMMKLGYIPDRVDSSYEKPSKHQEISFDEQKAPPDFDASMPPIQNLNNGQEGSHSPDNILIAKSNHDDDGKDATQPPNVQEALLPLDLSRESASDIPQEASRVHFNHATGDRSSSSPSTPAAASDRFDSGKYEAWELTYRKSHVKRENEYKEMVVITRPFTFTSTRVEVIPASYIFNELKTPESDLKAAVHEKGGAPVNEIIKNLPLAAQEAVGELLNRRSDRRPSVARLYYGKLSLWGRLMGRYKFWPPLVVYLECELEILRRSGPPGFLSITRNSFNPTGGQPPYFTADPPPLNLMPMRNIFNPTGGQPPYFTADPPPLNLMPMRNRLETTEVTRQSDHDDAMPRGTMSMPRNYIERQEESEVSSDVEDNIVEGKFSEPLRDRSAKFAPRSELKRQALPSEHEAERIMEEFLSRLTTTSQDIQGSTHLDDTTAATVPTAGDEAKQES